MAGVILKHPPSTEPNVLKYKYYRADAQLGPFVSIGELDQPDEPLPSQVQFTDLTGTLSHWYKIEAIDTAGIPNIATDAFQAISNEILTRVWDVVYDAAKVPIVGLKVDVKLSRDAFYQSLIVPRTVSTVTNAHGYWYLDLFPNETLTEAGGEALETEYLVVFPGVKPSKTVLVPIGDAIQFKDLTFL
jgi:hypothetical protein